MSMHGKLFRFWRLLPLMCTSWLGMATMSLLHAASIDEPPQSAQRLHLQSLQIGLPLASSITPEQLIFALRKRELSTSHNSECTTLHNKVQRLRRAERRAPAEQQSQFAQDLAKAQQRQQKLRCPQAPKL